MCGSFGTNHSRGAVVLYRSVLECRSVVCEFDGRFVLVEFSLRGSVFRVASIYAPNRNPDRDAFFVRCIDSIDPAVPTLLCGDFNTVLDRVRDRCRSCPFDVEVNSKQVFMKDQVVFNKSQQTCYVPISISEVRLHKVPS